MTNLPNITQTEMAVLAAAVLLLFIAPALLSWSDERRRRRAERALRLQESALVAAAAVVEAPGSDLPTPEAALFEAQQSPEIAPTQLPDALAGGAISDEALSRPDTSSPPASPAQALPIESGSAAVVVAELLPLSGAARHRFRLDDLHLAQLSDWPPAAIRDDPDRRRSRHEAEAVADPYQTRLRAAVIVSPYPARAHCLGAADADASELRLSYLLFPVVWPVSQNQAVAQAVFRIERATGAVRGWVDALRPQELSEENRREIVESGGEV